MAVESRWKMCKSKKRNGRIYYYNILTKESVWEKPKDFDGDIPSMSTVSRGESICNNNQPETDSRRMSAITNCLVQCNDEIVRNDLYYGGSDNHNISERSPGLYNEEVVDDTNRNAWSQSRLLDSYQSRESQHSSTVINVSKINENVKYRILQHQEYTVDNKKRRIEEISSHSDRLPKQMNVADKQENCEVKDNGQLQLTFVQSKVNRQQRNPQNLCNTINKKIRNKNRKSQIQLSFVQSKVNGQQINPQNLCNTINKKRRKKNRKSQTQLTFVQSKVNGQQRNPQNLCNTINKKSRKKNRKKLPLTDLRTKLKSRNLPEVQAVREKSCSFNCPEDEIMEWESIDEDQIHNSIICARKEIQTESIVSSEMEWITSCANQIEFGPQFYIVVDTNVLVKEINFIKKLRYMSGNGCPLLFIPYQVLLELDHLKQKKSVGSVCVRQAIDIIYQTFKMDRPRIHGQSASEAQDFSINLDKTVPDDAIINCCLQQIEKRNYVVLLTLDKNLSSKAFMNGIKVYSVDDMSKNISEAKRTSVSLKQAIFGDETTSAVISKKYIIKQIVDINAEEPATAEILENCPPLLTEITDKLKGCLHSFVNNVLERGMYLMYGEKWIPRCVIRPPWNLEKGLKCLLHHWYAIMEAFVLHDVKSTIKHLQKTFPENNKTLKTYSTWTQDTVIEVLEASSHLSSALSPKYAVLASTFNHTINELRSMINKQPVVDVNSIEPSVGTDEQALVAATAFGDMWTLLWNFCTSLYVALGWEKLPTTVASVPSLEEMKEYLTLYYTTTLNLQQAASGILESDFEELTVAHPSVVLFHTTVHGFLERTRTPLSYDISVRNIVAFSTRKEYRDKLSDIMSPLEELRIKFMKCVDHILKMEQINC